MDMNNQELYDKIHNIIRGTQCTVHIDDEWIFITYDGNNFTFWPFYEKLWLKMLKYSREEVQQIASLPKEELDILVKLVKIKNLRKQADEIESSITI